ncbi:hypothetical protein SCUCBS95973_004469 [Sporothrix curviconia]|uniref:Uncharacterized protein n=1 Tax=Sporothrix curviconia TaxID=1260050 RepID=A0ABP0BNZ3_9PEZI
MQAPVGIALEIEAVHVDLAKLEFLAAGKSGIVYATDDDRVVKQYYDPEGDKTQNAALQLDHLRLRQVLHADADCHSMVVVEGRVKLIDFEG